MSHPREQPGRDHVRRAQAATFLRAALGAKISRLQPWLNQARAGVASQPARVLLPAPALPCLDFPKSRQEAGGYSARDENKRSPCFGLR